MVKKSSIDWLIRPPRQLRSVTTWWGGYFGLSLQHLTDVIPLCFRVDKWDSKCLLEAKKWAIFSGFAYDVTCIRTCRWKINGTYLEFWPRNQSEFHQRGGLTCSGCVVSHFTKIVNKERKRRRKYCRGKKSRLLNQERDIQFQMELCKWHRYILVGADHDVVGFFEGNGAKSDTFSQSFSQSYFLVQSYESEKMSQFWDSIFPSHFPRFYGMLHWALGWGCQCQCTIFFTTV